MDMIKKYGTKPEQSEAKKEHPALAAGKELDKKMINDILVTVKDIHKRQEYLNTGHEAILNRLNNFNKLSVKSQIPFITPRQLYAMYTRGWRLDEMSAISGYTTEDIDKKLKSYNQNYVAVNK